MGYRLGNGIGLYFPVFSGCQRENRNLERTVAMVSGGSGSLCIPGSFAVDTVHRSFTFWTVGAGDMKLMAVFAVWLGLEKTGKVFIAGLLLGAVLSLLKMLQDGSAWERFLYLSAYIRQVFNDKKVEKYYVLSRDGTGCVIPLGACFCAGAILILVL